MDQHNYGVIEQPPAGQDYIAGEESGVEYKEILPGADWTLYLSPDEIQKTHKTDLMNCVTQSALNEIESQLNRILNAGEFKPEEVQELTTLGYITGGKFQFSKRYTAKMSGTTTSGNSAQNVAYSARHHGLLPQAEWPVNDDMTWAEYYAAVPQKWQDKAQNIYKFIEIKYEFVWYPGSALNRQDQIKKHLKQAPLQILAPVCSPWNTTGIIKSCGKTTPQHATTIYKYEDLKILNDFDHYYPTRKRLAWDYYIPYVFKIVALRTAPEAQNQAQEATTKPKHIFSQPMQYGQRSGEITALQDCLKAAGVWNSSAPSTGYYGNITARAVTAFQTKYKIADQATIAQIAGKNVGPATRKVLNELFQ